MDTEVLLRIRTLGALAFCTLLAACTYGQGDTTSTEVAVEGNWSGTYIPPAATHAADAYALIQKDGTALFYDDAGVMYRLPVLDGAYTFQGPVTAYAPIGYYFTSGAGSADFIIDGTAVDSGIDGSLHDPAGNGSLRLIPFETLKGKPSVVAGQWIGYYITPTPYFVGLTVDAAGAVTGDDVFGCHLTGRITQRGADENLFDVTVTTVGPKPVCGITYTGLAHETDYDTFGYFKGLPGTYYYLGLLGKHSAFAAELKVQ